mmetsp:Transcript_13320/g.21466  ORF Transcript_13320/g.21466 Transcript_13320/m.21466 type:complete len:292 (-) Transcript_13320:123-998(-)|eukprot:CAMPEP_0178743952 /NCGR_PEP_ID=MMETSP0744-20121128/6483_1 /TAXON_ID=913974 /ORGANISM="Nitzschia punctata, Strain CCMP561" /LENGTH=291 /DNA_ID=CAMNT_0020396997 /DNA_START=225 /DNA_END=1100 /DNA_ORIENTATION=+
MAKADSLNKHRMSLASSQQDEKTLIKQQPQSYLAMSMYSAAAVKAGNNLKDFKPVSAMSSTAAAAAASSNLEWRRSMTISRRNLMDDSPDEREEMHVSNLTPTKRKARPISLLQDEDDGDSDTLSREASHMGMSFPSSSVRNAKARRRCHSMFPSCCMSKNFKPLSSSSESSANQSDDRVSMEDMIALPTPLLVSQGSLSTVISRSTTATYGSNESPLYFPLEGYDEESYVDGTEADEPSQEEVMRLSLPKFHRNSTIRDPFDLATSIEAFRTSLKESEEVLEYCRNEDYE